MKKMTGIHSPAIEKLQVSLCVYSKIKGKIA
jgi:hypothetical protein